MARSIPTKRLIPALVAIIGMFFSAVFVSDANAYYWPGIKWGFYIQTVSSYSDVTGNYLTSLNQAIDNFNTSTNVHLSRHSGSSWVAHSMNYGNVEWEGQTETDATNGKTTITWVVSKINTHHIASNVSAARMKVLWLHELCHGWGLGHNEKNTKVVMYPSASVAYGYGVRSLTKDDISGINRIYPIS